MHLIVKHFHTIAIPPLLPITLAFIVGILWQSFCCNTTATTLILLLAVAIFCCIGIKNKHIATLFTKNMPLCCFFVFAGAYLYNKQIVDHNEFYAFATNSPIAITGVVIDKNKATTQYNKATVIAVSVDVAQKGSATKKIAKTVMIYTENDVSVEVGDTVTFCNITCKQPTNDSFNTYQIKEQIAATVFDNKLKYIVHDHPEWSLRRWIWNQKQRLLNGLMSKLSPDGFRFFSSLFLGNRACVKASLEKTNEQFKIWGISHFLARSGLHLALFIFIWQTLFCFIPLPFIIKQLIITFASCSYFILTWTSAPFTRSFALFLLHKVCVMSKLPFHLLHYLTLICFCFLLYCPLYLFFLDFQLSFALTFALAWLNQLCAQYKAD